MKQFTSQAFVYHKPGDVRLEEITIPAGDTDIVVKVIASARCGTDKTIYYHGHPKVDANAPIVLGHELVGEVVYVGEKVKTLAEGIGCKEGQKLTPAYLDFKEGERLTFQSRIARYRNGLMLLDAPLTILSFYINGGYSQYMKVPKELVQSGSALRVPDTVTDEEAALVEPAACALESIFATPHPVGIDEEGRHIYRSGIQKDGRACVIGSGTVSMIYALLCKVEGSAEVYLLVRSEEKAAAAKELLGDGFTIIVNEPYEDRTIDEKILVEDGIVERLAELTGGHLFDDVITACASPDAQRLMLRLYNPSGYAVGACFGGTHTTVDRADIDKNHYRTAKTIGTSGCSNRGMETVLAMLEDGRLSLKGFLSPNTYTFKTDPAEFFTTAAGGLKPVLYPWE